MPIVLERFSSVLSELSQVSETTNNVSDAAPSNMRSGNQSQISGIAGNRPRSRAAAARATITNKRMPSNALRRGSKKAMQSTPTACIAALAPIMASLNPISSRSSAMSAALRLYVRPNIIAVLVTAVRENTTLEGVCSVVTAMIRRA